MHVHFLDPYHPSKSAVHTADPRVKLACTLLYVATCSLTPMAAWPAYIVLFAIVLAAEILSRLGMIYVIKRAALALPFALAALPMVFTTEGRLLFAIPLGSNPLAATAEGFARFTSIVLKSWFSVQAAIVLTAATPFPQLLQAMRAIRVPRLLVAIFGLMWRYMFVLVDEALRLVRARAARSGYPAGSQARAGGTLSWRARVTGGMAGNLLLRALERSEHIYAAMLSRGYDGEARALPLPPLGIDDKLTLVAAGFLALLLLMLGSLFAG
jgi:cobalt/nickel transport system permease protein